MRRHRRYGLFVSFAVLASLICSCAPEPERGGVRFATTIRPLEMILSEIVEGRAEVQSILPPGASPHTFEPRPSEIRAVQSARALIYVGNSLDGWAARMPAHEKLEVFELLPESERLRAAAGHTHSEDEHAAADDDFDPHFWTDPVVVKSLLPSLSAKLAELDPEGREIYEANSRAFADELDALDAELKQKLSPVRGLAFFLFHPSFQYFFNRYGIELAGVMEPFPGREPTPKELESMIARFRETGALAVITEPQSSKQSAAVLAEAVGAPLIELDPIGGVEGRRTYAELLHYNADELLKARRPNP